MRAFDVITIKDLKPHDRVYESWKRYESNEWNEWNVFLPLTDDMNVEIWRDDNMDDALIIYSDSKQLIIYI